MGSLADSPRHTLSLMCGSESKLDPFKHKVDRCKDLVLTNPGGN